MSSASLADFLDQLQDPDPTQRNEFVDSLPKVYERQLLASGQRDENCPICQDSFLSVLASEEMAEAMDSPAISGYDLGVTKLPKCGHHFCRKDISKWIIVARKDTCPSCRSAIGLPPPPAPPAFNASNPLFQPAILQNLRAHFAGMEAPSDLASQGPDMQQFWEAVQGANSEGGGDGSAQPFGPAYPGTEPESQHQDDRSDFSGMYS